jgi:hypothetical protein
MQGWIIIILLVLLTKAKAINRLNYTALNIEMANEHKMMHKNMEVVMS